MPSFSCRICGDEFSLPQHVLDRYPGWEPSLCRRHRDAPRREGRPAVPAQRARRKRGGATLLSPDDALDRFSAGPTEGVFTDGGASPNPGPGGWGAVYVAGDEIIAERHGHDPATTNNRMELTALIEGASLVPAGEAATVYTDSRLAVNTINQWASGWEQRGWKRKRGPVENLDLVKRAYAIYRDRPELSLRWIEGHAGYKWNEYADALANKWRR